MYHGLDNRYLYVRSISSHALFVNATGKDMSLAQEPGSLSEPSNDKQGPRYQPPCP